MISCGRKGATIGYCYAEIMTLYVITLSYSSKLQTYFVAALHKSSTILQGIFSKTSLIPILIPTVSDAR